MTVEGHMRLAATLIVLGLLGCKSPPAYKELTKEEQIAQAKKTGGYGAKEIVLCFWL